MLDALFSPNSEILDTTSIASTLLTVFRSVILNPLHETHFGVAFVRRRAFQLEVHQTRERLRKLSSSGSTRPSWTNPLLLSSRRKLQPLISVVNTGLQRLQSFRSFSLSSQESRFSATRRFATRLFSSQQYRAPTSVVDGHDSQPCTPRSTSLRDTLASMENRGHSSLSSDFIEDVSSNMEGWRGPFEATMKVAEAATGTHAFVEQLFMKELQNTSSRGPDIVFYDEDSNPISTIELGGQKIANQSHSSRRHPLERWRRTVLLIRCGFALFRALKAFRSDLLSATMLVGLTVEELQNEVVRLNLHRKISRVKDLEKPEQSLLGSFCT